MENKDTLDSDTPTGGDTKDSPPPYVGYGLCGLPVLLNRTEEAEGSNPSRSTGKLPYMAVFLLVDGYIWGRQTK